MVEGGDKEVLAEELESPFKKETRKRVEEIKNYERVISDDTHTLSKRITSLGRREALRVVGEKLGQTFKSGGGALG